jgi:hypothetical protein
MTKTEDLLLSTTIIAMERGSRYQTMPGPLQGSAGRPCLPNKTLTYLGTYSAAQEELLNTKGYNQSVRVLSSRSDWFGEVTVKEQIELLPG